MQRQSMTTVGDVVCVCVRVFSGDILKGGNIGVRASGRGVLGVYYLLENIAGEVIVSSKF